MQAPVAAGDSFFWRYIRYPEQERTDSVSGGCEQIQLIFHLETLEEASMELIWGKERRLIPPTNGDNEIFPNYVVFLLRKLKPLLY